MNHLDSPSFIELKNERRKIVDLLNYMQKIVYDERIPEYVRIFGFTKTIRSIISRFDLKSKSLDELKRFKSTLQDVKVRIINTCQSYGIYDYSI